MKKIQFLSLIAGVAIVVGLLGFIGSAEAASRVRVTTSRVRGGM